LKVRDSRSSGAEKNSVVNAGDVTTTLVRTAGDISPGQ
jgi:hypothetical protein